MASARSVVNTSLLKSNRADNPKYSALKNVVIKIRLKDIVNTDLNGNVSGVVGMLLIKSNVLSAVSGMSRSVLIPTPATA